MVPLMAAHNGGRLLRRRFLPVRNHPRLGATGVGRVVGARLLLARDAGLLRVCLLQAITSRDSPTRHQAWDCRSTTPWWDLRRIVICKSFHLHFGATLGALRRRARLALGAAFRLAGFRSRLFNYRACELQAGRARAVKPSHPRPLAYRAGLGVRWARESRRECGSPHMQPPAAPEIK